MVSFELVEKLKTHANVSYDEAKQALETCNGDLLEALILLERSGKVNTPTGGHYSSQGQQQEPQNPPREKKGETFGQLMKRFFCWCGALLQKGNRNHFEIWHKNELVMSIPVTVLLLLLLFCFCVTLPLLIIGLFCSCRYIFRGPEIETTGMNGVMDSVANTADNIKTDVINASQNPHNHE